MSESLDAPARHGTPGRMTLARVVAPETLDGLGENDPAAQRSRRDLRRIHRVMGTRRLVANALRGWVASHDPGQPWRVLELGAGDGTVMLGVAHALRRDCRTAELTLLDRQELVTGATLDRYAALGWHAVTEIVDVLDWAAQARYQPACGGRWDLVVANLFVHHFQGPALAALLAAIAARTDRFLAVEPRRGWIALGASHLVGALGANAVTREDAVLSVHAGFRDAELSAQWPGSPAEWRLAEAGAGLFSHSFRAERRIEAVSR